MFLLISNLLICIQYFKILLLFLYLDFELNSNNLIADFIKRFKLICLICRCSHFLNLQKSGNKQEIIQREFLSILN